MECPKCKEKLVVPAGKSNPVHECKPAPKAKVKKEKVKDDAVQE